MRSQTTKIYDFIAWVGALTILVAWVFERTDLQKSIEDVADISTSKQQIEQHASNKAIFDALRSIASSDKRLIQTLKSDNDRRLQIVLSRLDKTREAYDTDIKDLPIQVSYDQMLDQFFERVETIRRNAKSTRNMYLTVYIAGGTLTLIGSALKAFKG